jgi:trk system potassium uptake protein TrkH
VNGNRPNPDVIYYTGVVVVWLGGLMLIPIAIALAFAEWAPLTDFAFSLGLTLLCGFGLMRLGTRSRRGLTWTEGFTSAALSWIACMFLAAVPYYLSGHWGSYLDALFDVMSGFTTTGLVLVQDLDHIPNSINTWRHLLTYVGGQGMVVLALTVLSKGLPGAFKFYVGEAKDERLLPNVARTAQAIWFISVVYLVIGTVVISIAGVAIGQSPVRALLHGSWVFMGAWSTGGFAPQSQNINYYHSALYEFMTVPFMVVGSFNFALHYYIWTGRRKEILRNVEMKVMSGSLAVLTLASLWPAVSTGLYTTGMALSRRIVYQMISAQTTTGFGNVYAQQIGGNWPVLVVFCLSLAMLLGGSASSTAGGFKGIRTGLVWAAVKREVRKFMSPESAVVVGKIHAGDDVVVEDRNVMIAGLIILLYVATFAVGTLAGLAYGYSMPVAVFEAASVTGNTGLSAGLTSPIMPAALKVLYILMMWAARLEFFSVLVFFGVVWRRLRSR